MDKYSFQYCQKIVVFSDDEQKVLLCKRKGEADYDGTFSFIGGKMETGDPDIISGLKREKNEEVGPDFQILLYPVFSTNLLFTKKDGSAMILPHYYARHQSGEIKLSDEYSEFQWVPLTNIDSFEPKIQTIPEIIRKMAKLKNVINESELINI